MDWDDPQTRDMLDQANGEGCMEGAIITGIIAAIVFLMAMGYVVHSYETMIASIVSGG